MNADFLNLASPPDGKLRDIICQEKIAIESGRHCSKFNQESRELNLKIRFRLSFGSMMILLGRSLMYPHIASTSVLHLSAIYASVFRKLFGTADTPNRQTLPRPPCRQ